MPRFARLLKIYLPFCDLARALRWRILTHWHWWCTRRLGGHGFLPALRGFAFSTRSYFQRSRLPAEGEASGYIPIDDALYFAPPPPKTLGDNELATRLIPANLPLFAAQLCDARTYGDPGDVITADGILLADVSYLNPSDLWSQRRKHPLIGSDPLPEPRHLKGTYALLTAPFAGLNYFHWMFALLPRLAILERAGVNLANIDGYLINRLHFVGLQQAMLRVVGITPERIIEMDELDAFQPQALWVTSQLLTSGHRRRWLCDWLRKKFLVSLPPGRPSRRLYLSRADASRRRVANEDEVLTFLEPLGFEKVVIACRPVFEQSTLFADAEIVVGPQTAGFANILFCSPGTRIIDMIPARRYAVYFWELSACMGLDYYYAMTEWVAPPYPPGAAKGDTIMRLDRLASILRHAGVT